MADIAASVLARLKNKAAESGRSYQLCLQLFCQEEFLRRLEKSKYAENLVISKFEYDDSLCKRIDATEKIEGQYRDLISKEIA